jgi:DNA processing protein
MSQPNLDSILEAFSLLATKGIGPAKVNDYLGKKKVNQGYCLELSEEQKEGFQEAKSKYVNMISSDDFSFLDANSKFYPLKLKQWAKSKLPPILSLKGNIDLLKEPSVGFCGSRKASQKGINVAIDCVEQVVKNKGWVIVSGYAAGIDMTTHRAALLSGGKTIIVLPEGIMRFRIKKELKEIWDWNRVLVVSQFLPDAAWSVGKAMERNRTIIGLSAAMILIEAKAKGGSMAAGQETLKLNRPLFAPVYQGMPESAVGNRILISKGAHSFKKSKTTNRAVLESFFNLVTHSLEKIESRAPKEQKKLF